jgi:hypothetical protein
MYFLNQGKNTSVMCANGKKYFPRPVKNGITEEHVRILRNAHAFLPISLRGKISEDLRFSKPIESIMCVCSC